MSNLTDNIKSSYMVTINVWPNKLINNKQYQKYDHKDQQYLLEQVVKVAFSPIVPKLNYELTKAGNTHCHFMVKSTEDFIRRAQAYVHSQLGLPKVDMDRVFKYTITKVHEDYGDDYCTKEQRPVDPLDEAMSSVPALNVFANHGSKKKG